MILNLSKTVWVVVEVGEQHPLLVVWPTEDLVLVEIELVAHTEPEIESVGGVVLIVPESDLWPHCWQAKHSRW